MKHFQVAFVAILSCCALVGGSALAADSGLLGSSIADVAGGGSGGSQAQKARIAQVDPVCADPDDPDTCVDPGMLP
jgi:hypothetical protein